MALAFVDVALSIILAVLVAVALSTYIQGRQHTKRMPSGKRGAPTTQTKEVDPVEFAAEMSKLFDHQASLIDEGKQLLGGDAQERLNEAYNQAHFSVESLREMMAMTSQGKVSAEKLQNSVRQEETLISNLRNQADGLPIARKPLSTAASLLLESNQSLNRSVTCFFELEALLGERERKLSDGGAKITQEYLRAGSLERGTSYTDSRKQSLQTEIGEALEAAEKQLQAARAEAGKHVSSA